MRGARDPVRLYLEGLRSWEQDRGRYAKGDLNRRIESRFQAVIASLVRVASKSGSVFTTQDIALERNTSAPLSRRYTFAPHGSHSGSTRTRDSTSRRRCRCGCVG